MRRISLLLLLAVFAVGCASSTTVLGEPATELARVDDTVEPAPAPTSVIDPDWAAPARPIEPVATPEPTPTPEPVVLQLPDRDDASTAEDSDALRVSSEGAGCDLGCVGPTAGSEIVAAPTQHRLGDPVGAGRHLVAEAILVGEPTPVHRIAVDAEHSDELVLRRLQNHTRSGGIDRNGRLA